ncbi:MAG: glycosyltransferase family 4 protein [Candidatus Competibacteraceae bacterium]|nr:glycosyltransferase family 4 protein [Candidatus Competibacteraceae bacterium]
MITKTKRIAFDVIYAHDWVTLQTAVTLKEKTGKPFVAHVHSLDYDRGAARYRSFVFDIEREGLAKADAIIAVSNYTAGILVKHYGVEAKKIKVVHNAISPFVVPTVKRTMPEKLVLFVGRLSKQKGPEIFFRNRKRDVAKKKGCPICCSGCW